jgi:hypothetical protein
MFRVLSFVRAAAAAAAAALMTKQFPSLLRNFKDCKLS